MSTAGLTSSLPLLYAGWIGEILNGPIPQESKATCNDCAMCSKGTNQINNSNSTKLFFNPKIKCCTYLPQMFNFSVGRVLLEEDSTLAPGKDLLEARLEKRLAVSPLGIGQPPTYAQLYTNNLQAFGHSESLGCPYYLEESGKCGVWQHRNSVCSTWFCKHERGEVGLQFWKTVEQLLAAIEKSLTHWCILKLDVGSEALRLLFSTPRDRNNRKAVDLDGNQLDDSFDPVRYQKLWGKWLGREKEFYKECARLVNNLSWQQILEIGGSDIQIYISLLKESYQSLVSTEVPDAVRLASFRVLSLDNKRAQIQAYSPFDPVELPKVLMDVLPYFDGSSTEQIVEKIFTEHKIKLEPELVRKLLDYSILEQV